MDESNSDKSTPSNIEQPTTTNCYLTKYVISALEEVGRQSSEIVAVTDEKKDFRVITGIAPTHNRKLASWPPESSQGTAHTEYLEQLKTKEMPTGAQLLARLLTGQMQEVEGHQLRYEEEHGIWLTNPYGTDVALLPPTIEACDNFIEQIRKGVEYGPTPH